MHQTPTTPPTSPPSVTDEAAAMIRYEALPAAERVQAARLVAHTGCSLAMAVAAVEALRTEEERP